MATQTKNDRLRVVRYRFYKGLLIYLSSLLPLIFILRFFSPSLKAKNDDLSDWFAIIIFYISFIITMIFLVFLKKLGDEINKIKGRVRGSSSSKV